MASIDPDSQSPSYDYTISAYFYLLIVEMVATLGLAVFLYGEPFHFWEYAFSDLGDAATLTGKVNASSRLVYTLGMLAAGWIMLRIWAAFKGKLQFRNQTAKRNLGALGTVGFLLSALSNSQHHVIHSIGVAMVVASLYFFTITFHIELRASMPPWQFYLDVILLQVVVFSYAVAFFADWPTKQGFQKVCIMGVFYAVLKAVSVEEEAFQPREVLGVFGRLQR